MKLLFIGSTRRGFLGLKAMVEAGIPVSGIISLAQEAHEAQRYETAFRELAESRNIPLRETRLLRDPSILAWAMAETQAECAFVVGARVLLPDAVFNAFPKGCWAVHDSLLPHYRGFAPLNWAIINGEKETGVTLFQVASGIDTGDVLLQRRLPLGADETAPQAYERVCAATTEILLEAYRVLQGGKARPRPQNHALATFTCSRTPADGLIDWSRPTLEIYNLVRALTFPYPGAFTFHGGQRLFVVEAMPLADAPSYIGRIPGRVIRIEKDQGVDVLTGDGVLRLRLLSEDGKGTCDPAALIRSVRTRLGVDWVAAMAAIAKQPSS